MQPSSLIFVAVIGIWAAFLVQHWVRRREDLATARSLDRFSEAMRVLQRSPVVAHLRMRDEGVRERYMHIEGRWCDHRTFALTTEDCAGRRTITRWVQSQPSHQPHPRHTDRGPTA